MGFDFSVIFNALAQSPGNLIFFLVVSLPLILILILALTMLSKIENRAIVHHVLTGCGILLILQSIIYISSFFSPNNLTNSTLPFTIIECLTGTLMITWITWTFLSERVQFHFTGLNILLSLVLALAGVGSIFWIILLPEALPFDVFRLLIFWQSGSLILTLIGLTLILKTRPQQWIVAAAILVVLAAGYALQLVFQDSKSYQMGAVRLAQMLSLPWMLSLVHRFGKKFNNSVKNGPLQQPKKDKHVDIKPTLVDQLLKISLQETPENKYKAAARAISFSVVADMCYLAKIADETGRIQLLAGYDLIRERFLPIATLTRDGLQHIMDAWQENKSLLLSRNDSEIQDVSTLTSLLRHHSIGNLLAYPLSFIDGHLAGGLILLSPYTNKPWGKDTVKLFDEIKGTLSEVIYCQSPSERLKAELDQSKNDKIRLQEDKKTLTQILIEKQLEINEKEASIKQLKARLQIEKITTVRQIEQLQKEINELITQAAEFELNASKCQDLHKEIDRLSKEKGQLQKELMLANTRIKELETKSEHIGPIQLSNKTKIISLDAIAANIKLQKAAEIQQRHLNLEIINPDSRQMIKTDPEMLHTILIRLMENAIEASEVGGKIQMSQKLSLATGMLILEITDFGEGLSQTEKRALFNADREEMPGIGSYKSIRDAISAIRLLKGKIWLKSKKKEFTTFRVQVPVRIID
ncbi:MAG: ATP-binding protein [Chloroflexota bacterium]|nr:ATP-binding protein [Chloroflexota bacterium]